VKKNKKLGIRKVTLQKLDEPTRVAHPLRFLQRMGHSQLRTAS